MSNAFNWQGQPSIFTTGKDRPNFIGTNHERSKQAAFRTKPSPVSLPGMSKNLPLHTMRRPT